MPDEWNIRDAYIASPTAERVVDFRDSNLHVVGYSVPVRARDAAGGAATAPAHAPRAAGLDSLPDVVLHARPGGSASHGASSTRWPTASTRS